MAPGVGGSQYPFYNLADSDDSWCAATLKAFLDRYDVGKTLGVGGEAEDRVHLGIATLMVCVPAARLLCSCL